MIHRTTVFSILTGLLSLLLLTGYGRAEMKPAASPDCFATSWPHETSELAPDPTVQFGRLANGLRYVVRQHDEPRDRTAAYLGVLAGSLHEEKQERGLAHFLEHMLFNGTSHFPPGTLIDYFQSIGMSFGGDTNALTAYDRTVYKIILPRSSREDLDRGLLVLSDFAGGALLTEEEVDQERGVIMAEMIARDSAGFRAWVDESEFTLRGTRLEQRMPIGDPAVLRQAGPAELRDFYDAWYRPENMILVLVGDFDPETAEELIKTHFGPLQGRGDPPPCPDLGRMQHGEMESFYHAEPELGYTEVVLETVADKEAQPDSFALQRQELYRLLATQMINHRLARLVENADSPLRSAAYYDTALLDRFRISGIRAKTDGQNWQDALTEIDRVIRQAVTYGFSEQELDRVKRQLLSDLEKAVQTSDTTSSQIIARRLLTQLQADRVPQSPQQELALFAPVVEQATADQLLDVVRERWQQGSTLIKLIGTAQLPEETAEQTLLSRYRSLQEQEVAAPVAGRQLEFPYLVTAAVGPEPIATETFPDIDVQRFRYDNGLVVNVKQTDFDNESVALAVHFGNGRRSLRKPGLDLLAGAVVNGSGSGRYKASELQEVLAGSSVSHRFRIGEESFSWEGRSLTGDLELLFQTLQTVLRDPGFRREAYDRAMKSFAMMYRQIQNDTEGGVRLHLEPFLAGGAPGYGLPGWQEFSALTLEDVTGWLAQPFNEAVLEISVVGDVAPEQVRALAARYFGTGHMTPLPVATEHQPTFPAGETREVEMTSSVDKAVVRSAWLTDDFWDISRSRRLHVLAAVLENRLREAVRERLGASYSPFVASMTSRAYDGFGMMVAQVVVESDLVDTVHTEIAATAASLQTEPVSQEELDRAKRPLATSLRESVRTNDYWLHSVLSLSSRHPRQLDWPLTMIEDFAAVTVDEVSELAEDYLTSQRQAVGIIRPIVTGEEHLAEKQETAELPVN
ncbi:MAG: insulinase family protein [Desulfobulbaceae bacterium]|nr:insulinase family protein [Desulfobulbaceae bacterium]